MTFSNGAITLNRVCNLRCEWCYAKDTGYHPQDTMPSEMAKEIVSLCRSLHFRHVKFLGGEPTLYPDLFDLISFANQNQIRVGFPTNGVAFCDRDYVKELISLGIDHMSISLKGVDRISFQTTTGVDAFDKVMLGIENCLSLGATVVIFTVLSMENIRSFLDCVKMLRKIGVDRFRFTFVFHYDTTPGYKNYLEKTTPREVVRIFKSEYPELDRITDHRIGIFPTFPACFWGIDFIQMLKEKGQLVLGCPVRRRSDLIFDCSGKLIPCSAMYSKPYGQLYKDFRSPEELQTFCESDRVQTFYERCSVTPSGMCKECSSRSLCDSCSCQWTNYSFEQLMG